MSEQEDTAAILRSGEFTTMHDPGNSGWVLAGHWVVCLLAIVPVWFPPHCEWFGMAIVLSHQVNYQASRKRANWMMKHS